MGEASQYRFQRKRSQEAAKQCAQNWELLRQRAEEEGLYFEPLEMPGGRPTHALLWVARSEVDLPPRRRFNKRFLNIASPWNDPALADWGGFRVVRFFDPENRPVAQDTPNARAVEMIPLALYGLDHPKIPALLVDFRKSLNPKGRELSRYAVDDVSRYVLSLSPFGNLNFLLARSAFQFVTSRRGTDIYQPSRLRAYSQLKLLLSLTHGVDPDLCSEISRRLERVSTNSLENDLAAEARLAQQQYEALVTYAKRPDGLPARLESDRKSEMVTFAHRGLTRAFFGIAKSLSLGLYRHRDEIGPGFPVYLSSQRQIAYHNNLLQRVLSSGPQVEVTWNIQKVRDSLRFLAENVSPQGSGRAAEIVGRLFEATEDAEVRELCLASLHQINSPAAKKELLLLSQKLQLDRKWRARVNCYANPGLAQANGRPSAVECSEETATGG